MKEKTVLSKLKIQLAKNSNFGFVDISFDINRRKWKDYLDSIKSLGVQLLSKNSQETSRELYFTGLPVHLIVKENGIYKKVRSLESAKKILLSKD